MTTRYLEGLDGCLGATLSGGVLQMSLANPHGDVVTTVNVPAAGQATSINAWSDYTEYGAPDTPAAASTVGGSTGYDWLGLAQRGDDTTGLTLMGARLYNPTTAQFTSRDPIAGANDTADAYPADPINLFDTSGQSTWDQISYPTWGTVTASLTHVSDLVWHLDVQVQSPVRWDRLTAWGWVQLFGLGAREIPLARSVHKRWYWFGIKSHTFEFNIRVDHDQDFEAHMYVAGERSDLRTTIYGMWDGLYVNTFERER